MTVGDSIVQYESVRSLLLGSELGISISFPAHDSASGADFDALVSSVYVVVREILVEDIAFLIGVGALSKHELSTSIYKLRTARQHTDNQQATSYYASWVGPEPIDWKLAEARLTAQVEDIFEKMIQAASAVRRSTPLRQQWIESASVSVPSTFDAVCRDLDVTFYGGARSAKIRAVEGRYNRTRSTSPKSQVIADLCVQEVLSESGPLPIEHTALLEELGVLGARDAVAVLTLAYATARALPELRGREFSQKVSTAWWVLVRE